MYGTSEFLEGNSPGSKITDAAPDDLELQVALPRMKRQCRIVKTIAVSAFIALTCCCYMANSNQEPDPSMTSMSHSSWRTPGAGKDCLHYAPLLFFLLCYSHYCPYSSILLLIAHAHCHRSYHCYGLFLLDLLNVLFVVTLCSVSSIEVQMSSHTAPKTLPARARTPFECGP